MGLRTAIARLVGSKRSEPWPTISLDEWAQWFSFGGLAYPFGLSTQTLAGDREEIEQTYAGFARAFKANPVIFACIQARLLLFSEARFQWQRFQQGRPGELFGDRALELLERPWPGGTTGDLLSRAELDVSLGGNFFVLLRPGGRLARLRPDWVTIIVGSRASPELAGWDVDAEVTGYAYTPGGIGSGQPPRIYGPEVVAHYAPIPDPEAHWRGMSWLQTAVRDLLADGAATTHKLRFFEKGATPNMVVEMHAEVAKEAFDAWVKAFQEQHEGTANAYKTLFLGGGSTAKVLGANLRQADFRSVQGAGETRIAAAAGVPPVIVGLSEGLAAATYSNYGQARRRFADGTMRPLWRSLCGALEGIVDAPAGARLWYDDRHIPFLQEDAADDAKILVEQSAAIRQLSDAGYEPNSVIDAVTSGDLRRLRHSGLFSVQLQGPGAPNGSGPAPAPVNVQN
ncbi:MAG: phage portal protein [Actinobacteria bacterium]|nr:phage portal protein [Actinomycetota bacterium]